MELEFGARAEEGTRTGEERGGVGGMGYGMMFLVKE